MSYTWVEKAQGHPGPAPRGNGAWFAGWGYMRFWEPNRALSASHGIESDAEGAGDDELFPGRVVAEPAPLPSTMLGMSPAEYEARLRRYGKRRW